MQAEWFRGVAITVRYDEARQVVLFVANRGRVPTLECPATGLVAAEVDAAKLVLRGAFDGGTRIVLKLPPGDAQGIARVLGQHLALPRQPRRVTLAELPQLPAGSFIAVEGRCRGSAERAVLDEWIALTGSIGSIEHDAPYRVTGFWTPGEPIRVVALEHLNPPVTWFTGDTVQVIHAPERALLGVAPRPGHRFSSPSGTVELWVPADTLASVAVDGDALVFEGDFGRTNYETPVRLAPVGAGDARATVRLLADKLQLPRMPHRITAADVPQITRATFVVIDGTFRMGHIEGPNFDGDIQVRDRGELVTGTRYCVTGFLYPRFRPTGPYIGYTGPQLVPVAVDRLAR
jgi:hypothetical protein